MSAKTQELSLCAGAGAERPDGKSWGAAGFAWSRGSVPAPDAPIAARRPPFDSVTIGLHWTTVILVLALFATAWSHGLAEKRWSELAPTLLQIHRSMGVTIWFVTALRLAWRLTHATLPPFPAQMEVIPPPKPNEKKSLLAQNTMSFGSMPAILRP